MTFEESVIEALNRRGWQRRFTATEPRLSEAIKLYEDLGFDVHLEPVPQQETAREDLLKGEMSKCGICFHTPQAHYVIFTKPTDDSDHPSPMDAPFK